MAQTKDKSAEKKQQPQQRQDQQEQQNQESEFQNETPVNQGPDEQYYSEIRTGNNQDNPDDQAMGRQPKAKVPGETEDDMLTSDEDNI